MPVVVPVVVVPEVPVAVVVFDELVLVVVGVRPKDCGSVMPRLRTLSRLTDRMATSTTTSDRARSRSLSNFCASRS